MKKKILTFLALLMTIVSGAWAQTYTVTFSGAYSGSLNKAFNNVTMPYSFSAVNGQKLSPSEVIADEASTYTNVYVSSGGEGKVSVSYNPTNMTITISGAFEGTATIHCDGLTDEEEGIRGDVYVTCVENKVNVTGVTLSPTSATLTLGETETVTLTPTVLPAEATDKSVTWSSSNEAVATVSNEGVVTAVAAGEATITVTATNGTVDTSDDKTATCTVTVTATYSVALKKGTEDATNWQGKAGEGEYQALPLEGVAAGTAVTVKYDGTKLVKSVKAVKKPEPKLDLATVTEATTVEDGYTVFGTLGANVKISIADGATVTLDGVTIPNGQIACSGNATIILMGTNAVTGANAAIKIGGSGTTLTITGSGSLTAQGGWGSAGIGTDSNGSGGNIVINGGTVTATGGMYGAGIGTGNAQGSNNTCGDITINGGRVTAQGGSNAAGIGTGISSMSMSATGDSNNTCGAITIGTGVTMVTATKGSSAPNSIGKGKGGMGANQACGTITIGGDATTYAAGVTTSPFTYPTAP